VESFNYLYIIAAEDSSGESPVTLYELF